MMIKSSKLLVLISLFTTTFLFSQSHIPKKILNIKRNTNKAPKIDGLLTDAAWKGLEIAKDFVMMEPNNGEKENPDYRTKVKVFYDDEAIYISAMLYDPNPSKIAKEFTSRDNYGQADLFTVVLNPSNDGVNTTQFEVLITGTQVDAKVTDGEEDRNWSAVWKSATKILDNGWSVEMKIPYAALRFSNEEIQTWGINFGRKIINLNSQYSWNHIDNKIGKWTQYDGILKGIRNIDPPTRLSFYPYASTSVSHYDGETKYNNNLGLDLKYGITENFTLDLTLVPDFGQTAFDNVTLNLGPFEQRFNEQRQFFTEGTELFNKGRLFYSRRIGNRPVGYYDAYDNLATNEEVYENPNKVNMLNALKISGRTKGGLGIGFFNAITDETKATIKRTVTQGNTTVDEYYKKVTEPFANYNVLVLDQQFNQNSSVTFINTSVLREGKFRDANVTGLLYHLTNKANTYFADGYIKTSNIKENGTTETGYGFDSSIAKTAGNWQGEVGYNMEDDKFNYNDLGFQRRNNQQTVYAMMSYRILKPVGRYNSFKVNFRLFNSFLYKPGVYTGNSYRVGFFASTDKRFSFGLNAKGKIGKQKDFYEPRRAITEQRFLERNPEIDFDGFISTDFRKKFAFDLKANTRKVFGTDQTRFGFELGPRYRFSDKMSVVFKFKYNRDKNAIGYANDDNSDIIFGKRNSDSYENSLSGKYSFSTKSSLSLSFRHYWQTVKYNSQFYNLNTDGTLTNHSYTGNHDVNYNSWNLDLNYLWEFAPGSQLTAFYRNSIFNSNDQSALNFINNINELFNQPALHTFSIKFVYFIDYNNLKKIF
ncbi:hypothetical protein KCTC32516_02277 [Polaribacter huanghezhanensis]|uniref:DUF5916 domain-containing protein n=1 Tax=Polaribacter huanghezhanensis TaxID=1354726 RepID=UPI00264978F3|nr:DUF5916 domain-containing protein [Polaribacter huanghezhanensis]WKD86897.1 hypothetical protein KCTC32516_02277 [Polaribacter huanghezhanensis]